LRQINHNFLKTSYPTASTPCSPASKLVLFLLPFVLAKTATTVPSPRAATC
jgi:hypothetical protein